jgi:outer membrane protein assembly factor BamB
MSPSISGRCILKFLPFLVAIWIGTESAWADNWAHWRGPIGNGVATNANPPIRFSDTEGVRWKAAIPGRSSGSPIIWEQQVFAVSAVPNAANAKQLDFDLFCLERQTGKLLWRKTAVSAVPHEGTHQTNSYASASPCTDGTYVYAHFGSRGLHCFTMSGDKVWEKDFGDMSIRNGFGEGSSPTLAGDLILVPWDHEGPSILYALDKRTGQSVWEAKRDEPTCWSTPLVVDVEGAKQVVMNGQTAARAYDLATGKELWRCGGQTERPCASAVAGNGIVYVGSGFRGAFLGAFSPKGRGDLANTKNVLWTLKQDTPDVASPLLSGNRLYFYKGKTGQLTCLDARTGKPHYSAARVPGMNNTYASPIAAAGRVYLSDRSGKIVVIEDADALKVLAANDLGETVDATPAPVDKQLFIRGERNLFCIEG